MTTQQNFIDEVLSWTKEQLSETTHGPLNPSNIAATWTGAITRVGVNPLISGASGYGVRLVIGLPGMVLDVAYQVSTEGPTQGFVSSTVSSLGAIGVATLLAGAIATAPISIPSSMAAIGIIALSAASKYAIDKAIDYGFENQEEIQEAVKLAIENVMSEIENIAQEIADTLETTTEAVSEYASTTLNNIISNAQDLAEHVKQAITPAQKLFDAAQRLVSPLILDLDGDGVETTNLANGVYFDHDGNGFAEQSAWVGKDDGILVWDRNNDGIINNGNEVFGDHTTLSNSSLAAHGFAALADLDTNSDGKIDANDVGFASLRVLKGDGSLHTLADLDIQSLNLSYTNNSTTDSNGNVNEYQGTYTKTDNSTGTMADIYFVTDPVHRIDLDPVEVSTTIAALPNAKGYGNVYDLHQAMERDTSGMLQDLVEDFVNAGSMQAREALLDDIIFTWTDAANQPQGDFYQFASSAIDDPRTLAALEQFMGQAYQGNLIEDAVQNQTAALLFAYHLIRESVYTQLAAQSSVSSYLNYLTSTFDPNTGETTYNLDLLAGELEDLINTNPADGKEALAEVTRVLKGLGIVEYSNWQDYYDTFAELGPDYKLILDQAGLITRTGSSAGDYITGLSITPWLVDYSYEQIIKDVFEEYGGVGTDEYGRISASEVIDGGAGNDTIYGRGGDDVLYGGEDNDALYGESGDDSLLGGSGSDSLNGQAGNDYLNGEDGDDYLHGGDGDDLLFGGAGQDTIVGGDGHDTIYGGTGNDSLQGGFGDDLYVFSLGDGQDSISEFMGGGSDRLKLNGILQDDVTLSGVGEDVVVYINGSSEKITLRYQLLDTASDRWIETLEFGDGSTLSRGQMLELLVTKGTDQADTLNGSILADTMYGYDGNDYMYGNNGDDTMYGGDGNDQMQGQSGNDLLYGEDGNDNLSGGNEADTLHGGLGNDTLNGEQGDDLLYGDEGTDSLYGGAANDTLYGGADNDYLNGGDGNDVLVGGTGNDTMTGGNGDDTYIFNVGDGQDSINELIGGGNDLLKLNGILQSDVTISGVGSNLVIYLNDSSEKITINNQLSDTASSQWIETLEFGDTSTLTRAQAIANLISKGTNQADSINGSILADTMYGYDGNDYMYGNNGDDTMYGGNGNDQMQGQSGNDLLYGEDGNDNLSGGNDADTLHGGLGNDTLNGEQGDDLLYGDEGTDSLYGGAANDTLYGGDGNDYLNGGDGNDVLVGGLDNDSLTGGAGDDTYLFSKGDGQDTVNNFGSGTNDVDKILFDSSVSQSTVAFYKDGTGHLRIGYTDSATDLITVSYFGNGGAYTIDRFELDNGNYMTDADINQIISDMAAYAATNSISFTNLDDVKNDAGLMAIINAGWNAA